MCLRNFQHTIVLNTLFAIILFTSACQQEKPTLETSHTTENELTTDTNEVEPIPMLRGKYTSPMGRDITVRDYFCTMDSLVLHYDSLTPYPITEHILVNANPWIIDSLVATDYYDLLERNIFVNDQKSMVILRSTDSLLIPDAQFAAELKTKLDSTRIDVNVPEFRLRIIQANDTIYSFTVRVGQNRTRYLEMAGYVMSLQTNLGSGTVVRIERYPTFINPVNGHRYYSTLRDDGKRTELPQIPWIETELDGIRTGDMIHPTTNPETLGKAWSNGCIGMREGDVWRVYYNAPLGTRVKVRYDLDVVQPNGDTLHLPDIYDKRKTIHTPRK